MPESSRWPPGGTRDGCRAGGPEGGGVLVWLWAEVQKVQVLQWLGDGAWGSQALRGRRGHCVRAFLREVFQEDGELEFQKMVASSD